MVCKWRSEANFQDSVLSPSTALDPETDLKLSGLAASTFVC